MAADATGIREYKGAAKATTITAGITSGATSFSIADSTGWPTGAVGNFLATADGGTSIEEKMLCSALAGGVITVVTRGYDNTAQVAHSSGCSFVHTVAAIDVAEGNYIANFDLTPAKTTPVDADVMPLKTSGVLHFVTWANIKATLKTYFDTIYTTTAAVASTLASYATLASPTFTGVVTIPAGTTAGAANAGYMGIPQNATTTGSATVAAADNGKNIRASATRTITIDSNANLALPIGFAVTFTADSGATMTIAITADTMYLAGPGTTGSRTLAPFGMATAIKQTATTWLISGNGLT